MHAVVPLSWCQHLEFSELMLNPVPEVGLNHLDPALSVATLERIGSVSTVTR